MDLLIFFLALAFFALFGVSIINARQTRQRLINQRLAQLKRRVVDMEEMAIALETLTGSLKIERIILDEIVDVLKGMLQLAPDTQSLEVSLSNALQRIEEIQSPGYHCQIYRLMESDASIATAQNQLAEAGRVIRKRETAGLIEPSEMNTYIVELAWAHLCVSVISLVGQGHKAVRRGDILRGFSFYKKAQQAAMESTISDERRHQIIRELGEILANRRKSLSKELMPETNYNPELLDQVAKSKPNQNAPANSGEEGTTDDQADQQ